MARPTPAMQQYMDIKNKHDDCLVLFRMGDFYETFYDDAKKASEVLDIALTARGSRNGAKVPLAGIPYHALDNYLRKLIDSGIKVAIVEQLENPKLAKGVVKRDVVRIVTPGAIIEEQFLTNKKNNYLTSVYKSGISVVDLSTGEFLVTNNHDVKSEIERLSPSEIIVPHSQSESPMIHSWREQGIAINPIEDRFFQADLAQKTLTNHFRTHSLDGFGLKGQDETVRSAGALLVYLQDTQKQRLGHIRKIRFYNSKNAMTIDSITMSNLEVLKNIRDKSSNHTLLDVLDYTVTPMGGRMLRNWLVAPLHNIGEINNRLDALAELGSQTIARNEISMHLKSINDMERLLSKVHLGASNARDIVGLRQSLEEIPEIVDALDNMSSEIIARLRLMPRLAGLHRLLVESLLDEPPVSTREGGIFKDGYLGELDSLRDIVRNSKKYIKELEDKEKKSTGIQNIRVGYNRVFGYYLEITKKYLPKVPLHYIRKQTMTNRERFVTEELKNLEDKILNAEERINTLEFDEFNKLTDEIKKHTDEIQELSNCIATLDCLYSLTQAALANSYNRPEVDESYEFTLSSSRHPVLEKIEEDFVPNDIVLNHESRLMIITGPNMAGKSTVMRQAALIAIMAHLGSFVPADYAHIGLIDRIFSRVGAHDDITHGQSTFMVEMNEVANILNNATEQSLVIMDEIGRGTSTYDGVSIAWAVAEHINLMKCKTMFATHYHVLTRLGHRPGVVNYSVTVKEADDNIIFLRKLMPGGTDKSYGIHVAGLAGMPPPVIDRARELQLRLEDDDRMHFVVGKESDKELIRHQRNEQRTLLDEFERF